jgi:hypothetical protein
VVNEELKKLDAGSKIGPGFSETIGRSTQRPLKSGAR